MIFDGKDAWNWMRPALYVVVLAEALAVGAATRGPTKPKTIKALKITAVKLQRRCWNAAVVRGAGCFIRPTTPRKFLIVVIERLTPVAFQPRVLPCHSFTSGRSSLVGSGRTQ